MLTKEQRDEILRLVQECVAAGNEGGGKQALALCDYIDSITVPEGWQVVPVEPTEEMHRAYWRAGSRLLSDAEYPKAVYQAMLAAAPKPEDSNE